MIVIIKFLILLITLIFKLKGKELLRCINASLFLLRNFAKINYLFRIAVK